MSFETIILNKEEHIATIIMNRPDKMNALNTLMLQEMAIAIDEIVQDDNVRVVVLTGAGKAFCSGADIREGGKASGLSGTPVEMHHNLRNSYQKIALGLKTDHRHG